MRRFTAVFALLTLVGCLPMSKVTEVSVDPKAAGKVAEDDNQIESSPNSPTQHVSGGGFVVEGIADTAEFNFNAKEQKGEIKGHAEFTSTDGFAIRMTVDCLVVERNIAWLSGTITEASEGLPVGVGAVFQIVDNGEGHKVIDQISRPLVGTTSVCADRPASNLIGVAGGNIQVHQERERIVRPRP